MTCRQTLYLCIFACISIIDIMVFIDATTFTVLWVFHFILLPLSLYILLYLPDAIQKEEKEERLKNKCL